MTNTYGHTPLLNRYDWADCSLTSVRHVGPGNSSRATSTELATKGFVASWNYESGRR